MKTKKIKDIIVWAVGKTDGMLASHWVSTPWGDLGAHENNGVLRIYETKKLAERDIEMNDRPKGILIPVPLPLKVEFLGPPLPKKKK